MRWFHEFKHLVIFLERDTDLEYEEVGRVHTEEEALSADHELLAILKRNNIPFHCLPSKRETVEKVVELALSQR